MLKINESLPYTGEIWYPFHELEEAKTNMWGNVSNRASWIQKAIEFTSNAELYGEWMMKVIECWPKSCEHNLSKSGDKRPWIGHAAVALAIDCPEDIVRQAWAYLSSDQQNAANKKAEQAINKWRLRNV